MRTRRTRRGRRLLVLCACAAVVACGGNGGGGDDGGDTADGNGDVCVPTSCAALGAECGPVDLGCGITDNCGGCGSTERCEAGSCVDCGPDGCDPECSGTTWADDCAARECQDPTGCAAGRCAYAAVDCSTGAPCPRRECRAAEVSGGGWENECVDVAFGPCATCAGVVCGVCFDDVCVSVPTDATFVTTSQVSSTPTVHVTGNVEQFLPGAGRTCVGTRCVTGGFLP